MKVLVFGKARRLERSPLISLFNRLEVQEDHFRNTGLPASNFIITHKIFRFSFIIFCKPVAEVNLVFKKCRVYLLLSDK